MERTIRYTGKDVTVLWKPHLCIHSTKCWKELSAVFKPQERTWIHPDAADAATVRAQVLRCP
ncbi:MAG: (4Fe-4S)-binding protein, partial [Bacteroidetes bacterium]|nr:(4Fe-4S)-binding protein [Bacteroidota bacterium]